MRKAGVPSLTALARHLHENEAMRRKCRAKVDNLNRVFHVLGDESTVGEGPLSVVGEAERYRVIVDGRTPPVLLATPSSPHARALLLALSDYITGRLHPRHGCVSCVEQGDWRPLTEEDEEGEEEEEGEKKPKETMEGGEKEEMEEEKGNKMERMKDKDEKEKDEREKKEKEEMVEVEAEVVVVGVFVEAPQPFLTVSLTSILRSGLHPDSTHFFVYNQVKEYEAQVVEFIKDLRETGASHVTLGEPVPDALTMARRKNELLDECKRLRCAWFLHWSTIAMLNPGIPTRLMRHLSKTHLAATHLPPLPTSTASPTPSSSTHSSSSTSTTSSSSSSSSSSRRYLRPVLSPGLRVQQGIEATFTRDVGGENNMPAHSWDHEAIMSGKPSVRGQWHASCVKEVYLIPREVLEHLTSPYTPSRHKDSNIAFCATLREAGVPMVVTTAIPNLGALVNSTGCTTSTHDITNYLSNPDLWRFIYLNPAWQEIQTGNLSQVSRPCDEVYLFPTFTDRFCIDLLHLAYSKNKWSSALKKDPRKKSPGIESVPTVDQWLSDLDMGEVINALMVDVFYTQLSISFPYGNKDKVVMSLLARFRPHELPGLPSHHDASTVTFHVHLTPTDIYQGGELEFPRQKCRVKADVGEVMVFPGRLTHPKILHPVTSGELNKLIIHVDLRIPMTRHH
ncbi:procollagen-lysine,2-oxoglutarate 5-dioxygenase 1-like isoform X2 [Eriocheir sinensis]|nr:procollagen-lysine,2-oxoglutarate 5-dioxygenase 1-like isoform X2 [Eriocheir sinensis]